MTKAARFQIIDDKVICNADAMSHVLQVKAPMMTIYRQRGLIVQPEHGKYDLVATVRKVLEATKNGSNSDEGHDFQVEKARLTKAQADKAEMEVSELSGDLVQVEDVVDEWQSQLMDMKGKLLSIPSKIATLVADMGNPAEVQELIDDYIREALLELSNYAGERKHTSQTTSGESSPEATTKADDQRMGRPRKKA
jgi:phage terminase Nu1 subunit (DNA packaging protein)